MKDGTSTTKEGTQDATGEVTLTAQAEPLKAFSFDTGLVPAGSPAQVSLKLSAGGGVKVVAGGTPSSKGLDGKAGSGVLGIDLHLKLDGRLKVTSAFQDVDEDLPGLKDIDIAIKGEQTFDPFLVGANDVARVEAKIPATTLPDIPLGATPGKLRLTVVDGSVLETSFHGTCVSVAKSTASYTGELTTAGNLILKGTLVIEAAGFGKEVDLGEIAVPIPSSTMVLPFADRPAAGAKDDAVGAKCGGAKAPGAKDEPSSASNATPSNETKDGTPTTPAPAGACEDANDPGGTRNLALSLGATTDTSEDVIDSTNHTSSDVDEDWYSLRVTDTGLDGNPVITASTSDRTLEVTVFHVCDATPNYSSCSDDGTADDTVGSGCRDIGAVTLDTSCSGTDESGLTYIRVRKASADGTCRAYDLSVTVR